MKIKGKEKVFFGTCKDTGARIYITKPSWACGWYWGFGYLGNEDCHYHLSSYQNKERYFRLEDGTYKVLTEKRNVCMYDALKEDYELNPSIEANLWVFCELILTAYTLKDTAEVLGLGGSHMTANPLSETIKNADEVKRINEVVLPAVFDKIQAIIEG